MPNGNGYVAPAAAPAVVNRIAVAEPAPARPVVATWAEAAPVLCNALLFSLCCLVALYYAVFAAGVRAPQSVDAMAMVYMLVTLTWLLIALRFVNPTQLVSRVKEHPQPA